MSSALACTTVMKRQMGDGNTEADLFVYKELAQPSSRHCPSAPLDFQGNPPRQGLKLFNHTVHIDRLPKTPAMIPPEPISKKAIVLKVKAPYLESPYSLSR